MATAAQQLTPEEASAHPAPEAIVVRFAGDPGDGMQLTGGQFTLSTALAGNDLGDLPGFPRRDPRAAGHAVRRLGLPDQFRFDRDRHRGRRSPTCSIAMNPAALKTNVAALKPGGLIIADEGEFTAAQPRQGRISDAANPLEDGSLAKWQLLKLQHLAAHHGCREAVRPRQQGGAALQEHVDAGAGALDVRPRPRSRWSTGSRRSSPRRPSWPRPTSPRSNAGHAYGETAELGGPMGISSITSRPAPP